jgi:hypothetical protein
MVGSETPIGQGSSIAIRQWNVSKRLAFRFCFSYLGLYCLTQGMLATLLVIPNFAHALFFPTLITLWPMRQLIFWTASHVFRVTHPLVYVGSGSGDKTFDWIAVFCLLVLAACATGIWSVLDRRRANYAGLYKLFWLFIRFSLASEMLLYGTIKIFPDQMPFPFLTRWVEPFGDFTPMGILWNSIGASPVYETFAGCAETLGGILLFIPRTTTLGALICLADLIQVFTLNVTYDIPVKLFSFHLILMTVFVLAPELSRLVAFFFSTNTVGPPTQTELFRAKGSNKIATFAQVAFSIYLLGTYLYLARVGYGYGNGRAKSEFYGIWNIEELSIDGQLRPPLLTDSNRWRRLVFDFPSSVNFQAMDDSFAGYGASIDDKAKKITLTKAADKNWDATLTFEQPSPSTLILDGKMDNHLIHMQLGIVDLSKYNLSNRSLHWIAEYPFNRLEVRR